MRDPPPELRAAVVVVGPHDIGRAMYGSGAFALADFLGWSATVLAQGDGRYDPADPTPALGGRHMSSGAGARDNRPLESRPDVLTFTSEPIGSALEIIGSPRVDVTLDTDNPHADVFIRLCDVDRRGRSRNVTEIYHRLDPGHVTEARTLSIELGACAHRFAAGHRLRLQVSGGAHPRYARNTGTGESIATATSFAATRYTIHCDRSSLTLPIA